jgi:hypothetical protein
MLGYNLDVDGRITVKWGRRVCIRFEMAAFWDTAPCSLVEVDVSKVCTASIIDLITRGSMHL